MEDPHVVHNVKSVAATVFLFIGLIGVATILENWFHQEQVPTPMLFITSFFICCSKLLYSLKL